jgi:hypothetical protein
MFEIGIVVPCWGRPLRTRRIIEAILNQNINNWEAFVIGDGCPLFQKMIDSGEANIYIEKAEINGNKLHLFNLDRNYGGFGYKIVDYAIENSKSKYFIFAGNDDILLENHFEHYLSEVDDFDMIAYPTFVGPTKSIRYPKLECSSVGHSEIIIKTELIKDYKHSSNYGHDWNFIEFILNKTNKIKISNNTNYTYIVTHIPGITIDIID